MKKSFIFISAGIMILNILSVSSAQKNYFEIDKKEVFQVEDKKYYLEKGLNYFDHGEEEKALKAFERALAIDPNFSEAYLARGDIYLQRGRQHFKIWDAMNRQMRINPLTSQKEHTRGDAQRNLERNYALAVSNYGKAIQYGKANWRTHFSRGVALLEKNRINIMRSNLGLAINDFDQAIALHPGHRESYYCRGVCQFLNDNAAEAYKDFEKLLIQNPNDAQLQFKMGECCEKLNNRSAAKASYEACARLGEETDPGLAMEASQRAERLK